MKTSTRRQFLSRANCAAISSVPILNTLVNLKLASSVASAAAPGPSDYRALVCLFFSGGMDTFNVLVPRSTTEYNQYKATRTDLALGQASLLALNPINDPGLQLGLHPGMAGLHSLFESGKAAIVSNVGTLVEPMTLAEFNAETKRRPLGLYSHSDQIEQWQTSTPNIRSARGWGGRAADILHALNTDQTVSMNISLSGGNIWQAGESVYEYAINTDGAEELYGYDPTATESWNRDRVYTKAVNSQLALDYQHLLSQAFVGKKLDALETYQRFNESTKADLPTGADFPENNYVADMLKMVAKSIAGHADRGTVGQPGYVRGLGHTRQTFFVEVGGWDHHSDLITGQAEQLPRVDTAVAAFYQALELLGVQDQVTLFTASDFARTLTSNGKGSDHAWGGNHFVVGGAVNGKRIYGQYPSLAPNGPLSIDSDRGTLIPTTSVDEYFAELALWLGVPAGSLNLVLPNIGNFYNTGGSSSPVGFLT
jgi:uncharacterized protein (DUF1501 family)